MMCQNCIQHISWQNTEVPNPKLEEVLQLLEKLII